MEKSPSRRWRPEEMFPLVEAFRSGEMNRSDFCEAHGISLSTFHYWQRKYHRSVDRIRPVAAHMLRHSYATHLLEAGMDIRYIQEVLGHSSVKPPQVYTHVARQHKPVSPLDSLDLGREKLCDFGENGGY